jgi:hypothetical protein
MDNNTSVKIFSGLAWFVAIYHLLLGLIGTLAPGSMVVSVAQTVFGVTLNPTAQFFVLSKFISAYMILMGIMMLFVAKKPYQYGALAWAAVIYFAIRIFNRLVFFGLLNEAFGTTMARNMVTVIPLAIIAIGLVIFRPRSSDKKKG